MDNRICVHVDEKNNLIMEILSKVMNFLLDHMFINYDYV